VENCLQGPGIKLNIIFPACGPENIFRAHGLYVADKKKLISRQF
jgi:hypothetical protein